MTKDTFCILLAEDNEDDIILIQEVFQNVELSNVIKIVRDGDEALAYLRRQGAYKTEPFPDILLLDINMPRKDGFKTLQEIKEDRTLKHLPVVMLTTSNWEEDILKSYSYGACSYITKPVGFEKFLEAMQQFGLYWTIVACLPRKKLT